jgi:hypothetical protein
MEQSLLAQPWYRRDCAQLPAAQNHLALRQRPPEFAFDPRILSDCR